VIDLGLVTARRGEPTRIANEIYQEVIPRELTSPLEGVFDGLVPRCAYVMADGRLDFRGMLEGFQQFCRESLDLLGDGPVYGEATPQLVLQSWLQRVVNGGGQIYREYALGAGRSDILVRYYHVAAGRRVEQRFVGEIKKVRSRRSVDTTIREGLAQTAMYADRCNPEEAHLVVIDPRERSWDEKIYVKECVGVVEKGGRAGKEWPITVWGM